MSGLGFPFVQVKVMALAAAAIKAHFKGDGQGAPPALGGPSAKAQRMFRASNAAVYGPSEDVGVADASGGTEVKDEAAKRRDFSRQSLDRQLMGVESVLQMQQSGKDDDEGSEKAGGGSKSMGSVDLAHGALLLLLPVPEAVTVL